MTMRLLVVLLATVAIGFSQLEQVEVSGGAPRKVSVLPAASSAVKNVQYIWTGATSTNACPAAGATGSGGSATAVCITHDGTSWQAVLQTDGSGNVPIGTTVLNSTGVVTFQSPTTQPGQYETPAYGVSFTRAVGGGADTHAWQLTDLNLNMPYRTVAYMSAWGAIYSGGPLIMSNKRAGANGIIQGLQGSAGDICCAVGASPDTNETAIGAEAHGLMGTNYTNQLAFGAYDLDDIWGGSTDYSIGYGRKKWGVSGRGTMFWGSDLSNTPLTSADIKLERETTGVGYLLLSPGTAANFTLTVKAGGTQADNIFQVKNSGGTVLTWVGSTGGIATTGDVQGANLLAGTGGSLRGSSLNLATGGAVYWSGSSAESGSKDTVIWHQGAKDLSIGADSFKDATGRLRVQHLRLTGVAQPSCTSSIPGELWYSGHTADTKDSVAICAADATNTWAWRTIY